jgi:hypothetical protein
MALGREGKPVDGIILREAGRVEERPLEVCGERGEAIGEKVKKWGRRGTFCDR